MIEEPSNNQQPQPSAPEPRKFEKIGIALQQIKDLLHKHVDEWIVFLGLEHWDIDVDYHGDRDVDSPKTAGRATVQSQYMAAHLDFYMPCLMEEFHEEQFGYIEYIVVHELCHVPLNIMRGAMEWDDNDLRNEEMAVVMMAKALMRARYEGQGVRK